MSTSSNTRWICSTISPGTPSILPTVISSISTRIVSTWGWCLAHHQWNASQPPTETVFGLQTRYDDLTNGLTNTAQRQFLTNTLLDHVNEVSAGIYVQNTMHWTDWFRTTEGWRGDTVAASINSVLQPANSGKDQMTIGSPKFTATLGPFYKTELFAGVGMGYHSNDARSTVTTQVPGSDAPQGASPLLVRSRGGEVGIRTKIVPDLDSSLSAFYIRQGSELFFDGDIGTTVAGLPSQRTGLEFTNEYRAASWFHIDADLSLSRARFLGFDEAQNAIYQSIVQGLAQNSSPQAQGRQVLIGNAPGNFVFNAPWMVASAGVTLGEKTGWFSSLRWRYFSSRPLTEDGAFQSPPFNVINGAVGYRLLAHPIRRAQPAELDDRPGDLRLRLAAHQRFPVQDVLSYPEGAGGVLPERHNGLCAAPDGAHRFSAHARWTDRYDQRAGNGGRTQARYSGVPTTVGELRLDRALCWRACQQLSVQDQR
jgi:hypothetical protein